MARILITGANSFVGRNFIKYSFHSEIDEVSLLDRSPKDVDFRGYDVVLHLVAIVHQSKRINEAEYTRVNRDLCLDVAKYAKEAGVKHFIFLSTVKVYGKYVPELGPWKETTICSPDDSYGKSKYEAEVSLMKLEEEEFRVTLVRTPLVYGEGVKANMYNILKLTSWMPVLPFKSVDNKRNFTSVQNLSAFLDRIIEKKPSGVIIAMDEIPMSTTDLVLLFSKYLEKKIFLFRFPGFLIKLGIRIMPRVFDRLYGSFEIDNTESLRKLDFKPPYSSEYCISNMIEAFRKNDL